MHPFGVMAVLGEAYVWAAIGQRMTIDVSAVFENLTQTALTLEPIHEELWKQIIAIPAGPSVVRQVAYQNRA